MRALSAGGVSVVGDARPPPLPQPPWRPAVAKSFFYLFCATLMCVQCGGGAGRAAPHVDSVGVPRRHVGGSRAGADGSVPLWISACMISCCCLYPLLEGVGAAEGRVAGWVAATLYHFFLLHVHVRRAYADMFSSCATLNTEPRERFSRS